jgi:hypothetical protein
MKGVPGLLIAVGLGIVGGFCNLAYLSHKATELEMVDFIAIGENVKINVGDKFNEGHFMKLSIPKNAVGNLDSVAVHWSDRSTVYGEPATKSYSPNELLLQKQIRTPPEMDIKKLLAADELAVGIPVDTRLFVSQLVNAGDNVSFLVPHVGVSFPTPADGSGQGEGDKGASPPDVVGPFRILALGNRLGSLDVMRASGAMPSQENVMTVAIKIVNGAFEPKSQRLLEIMKAPNFQQVQVVLHASPEAGKGK